MIKTCGGVFVNAYNNARTEFDKSVENIKYALEDYEQGYMTWSELLDAMDTYAFTLRKAGEWLKTLDHAHVEYGEERD